MASHEVEPDESLCLCRRFVPEPKRIDYEHVVQDPKTGKRGWKVYMRAHQDCPFHGCDPAIRRQIEEAE